MVEPVQTSGTAQNHILCALPQAERERLLPHLQAVTFSLNQVLYKPRERITHCYFPTSSVISLFYTTQSGSTAEMGIVGNDGLIGVALLLGGASTCSSALVTVAGEAFRIPAKVLQEEFARGGMLQCLLLQYTQALITQISQTAVCNRLHSLECRLCRWLLLCHDRASHPELHMTQELIAQMLGGRREGVTIAAGHLQDAGLIQYCRGHITILDRNGLEASVCECYQVVADETNRLFDRNPIRNWSKLSGRVM